MIVTVAVSGFSVIWLGIAAVAVERTTPTVELAATECRMRTSDPRGHPQSGEIVGFLTVPQALATIQRTQRNMGGLIDPEYVSNIRVLVRVDGRRQVVGVLVPGNMTVKLGEHVMYMTAHRNAALPCNYIPNLIAYPAISSIFPSLAS
jgi:hypothetical protein